MFEIIKYSPEHFQAWNDFVAQSKNGTFLFDRNYMDYHSDRFTDFSLLFYLNNKLFALLPANAAAGAPSASCSPFSAPLSPSPLSLSTHGGLTYGGLVLSDRATAEKVCQLFAELKAFLKSQGFSDIIYKCVPHIYHRQPSEEDLYALFKECNARLCARCISSTIRIDRPVKWRYSRRYEVNKAMKAGLAVEQAGGREDWAAFWQILTDTLQECHNVAPVHSLSEILLLQSRFPDRIRLFVAKKDGKVLAGILLYIFDTVVHSQYISASKEGKLCGAIDIILHRLLNEELPRSEDAVLASPRYFDFGHSTEDQGRYLNTGLIHQKEGFGGRAICYDIYHITL